FKETGFLGCPFCYEYFSPEIKEYLSKIHYSFVYKGKFPQRFSNSKEKRRIKKFVEMRNSIIEEIKEEKNEKC
ncbi:excinuclease ABC subunit B, partial [bacterium]|nr:excinuclease ABC subunit B [bacterium]